MQKPREIIDFSGKLRTVIVPSINDSSEKSIMKIYRPKT